MQPLNQADMHILTHYIVEWKKQISNQYVKYHLTFVK